MAENRLNIIQIEAVKENFSKFKESPSTLTKRMKKNQAIFERLWLTEPEIFDADILLIERERIAKTWEFLKIHTLMTDKNFADIGCGKGILSNKLGNHEAKVDAVDIADNALKNVRLFCNSNIQTIQSAMPSTSLKDSTYDYVLCTELIAYLDGEDYRLFFAELARILKQEGKLIFSSAIDINTDHGVERLKSLLATEFDITDEQFSYHAFYIRLINWLEKPNFYIHAFKNQSFYEKEQMTSSSFKYLKLRIGSSIGFVWIFYLLSLMTSPLLKQLKSKRQWLLNLEKICRWCLPSQGISHYLALAKKRSLQMTRSKDQPIETLGKKEIWN